MCGHGKCSHIPGMEDSLDILMKVFLNPKAKAIVSESTSFDFFFFF